MLILKVKPPVCSCLLYIQNIHVKVLILPQNDVSDPLVNNPLAQAEDSAWTKYFELKQLQKDITIDLERLNPDDDYFRQVRTSAFS
jgi:hypothetical protein